MRRGYLFAAMLAVLFIAVSSGEARSQSGQLNEPETPKFETTVVFTHLRLRDVGEGPGGVGGRFTFNMNDYLALEAEANYFPQNPSGNFGETTGFFGLKAGKRVEKIGMFGKVKPGFIRFDGKAFERRLSKKEFFAFEVGGVVEFYPSRHAVLRLDFSDVIIPYGGAEYSISLPPKRLGTSHNFQNSISVGIRF